MLLAGAVFLSSTALPVFADPPISVDGNLSDWQGKPSFVDTNGPDDGKDRDDINEYRLASDADNLYLLAAWDDTSFGNAQSSVGLMVYELDGTYFRVNFRVQGTQGVAPQVSMDSIQRCNDADCSIPETLCNGGSCGVDLALSTDWPDPFAAQPRDKNACDGLAPDCIQYDTAIEARIPWGQANQIPKPGNGQFAFMRFGVQGNNRDQASDPGTGNGIACQNNDDLYFCYKSSPTAVELLAFEARANAQSWTTAGALTGALLIALLIGLVLFSRSK